MLTFVLRRALATIIVLLVASFVVYQLTANSGDPLRELRGSNDPGVQARLESLAERLDLDTPPLLRYFTWLGGAAGCLIGRCDLGISVSRGDQLVTDAIATAAGSTLQLVTLSTVLAIVLGIAIGMTTALRQYSGYDYTVTFFAFVFYSLPIFWVAVLLKEFGAIRFNQFLDDPQIPVLAIIGISLVVAFIGSAIVGGDLPIRIRSFLFVGGGTALLLTFLQVTQWLASPSIGIIGVGLLSLLIAAVVVLLGTGIANRRALLAGGIMVAVALIAWYPLQFLFFYMNNPLSIVILLVGLVGIGLLVGFLVGGDDRRVIMRLAAIIGGLQVLPFILDQMFLRWEEYVQRIPLTSGVISTIGASTPSLARLDDMWIHFLDSAAHLVLPTIALMIISLASYTRYARSSLLEVLNQDYIRTARAKGLTERTVVMRHAFRNAMIPIATIIAIDIGAVIGGAVITERVFAWQGMGQLFTQGLEAVDVNLVMGFFLVTGILTVVFNVIADVLYSALDPRIRVS